MARTDRNELRKGRPTGSRSKLGIDQPPRRDITTSQDRIPMPAAGFNQDAQLGHTAMTAETDAAARKQAATEALKALSGKRTEPEPDATTPEGRAAAGLRRLLRGNRLEDIAAGYNATQGNKLIEGAEQ
jgi:hypothetical protein